MRPPKERRNYSGKKPRDLSRGVFTIIARSLFRIPESIATPSWVKANGKYLLPPLFEVTFWHLKNSSRVSLNIKSSGNLFMFLLTCLVRYFVSTP